MIIKDKNLNYVVPKKGKIQLKKKNMKKKAHLLKFFHKIQIS